MVDGSRFEQADCIEWFGSMEDASVHLILSDIPYGIGTDHWDVMHVNTNKAYLGQSPAQVKAGAVFAKRRKPINGWSEADRLIPQQYYEWCSEWAGEWLRVLKPGASAFVFAGRRLGHRCVSALEDAGFSYKDTLAWVRPRASYKAQRVSVVYERRSDTENAALWDGWRVGNLRPVFEPILWFTKPYKIGTTIADNILNHGIGGFNQDALLKYLDRPDNILSIGFAPGEEGYHPAQKPVRLMELLIELVTKPGQTVIDPFAGSGSTLIAAHGLNRRYLGCESSPTFAEICRYRLAFTGIQLDLASNEAAATRD